MAAISVRFDARQLKDDVQDILDEKVRGITSDQSLYNELSQLFYTYVISYLPEDTGALKLTGQGIAKNGYFHRKLGTIGGHHGVEFNAVEERPKGDMPYAAPIFRKIFKDFNVSEGIMDTMMSDGSWYDFCSEASDILRRYM